MKQNELETNLQSLSKLDLHIVLWVVRLRWLRHKASHLHPRQLFIPATLLQIIAFILSTQTQHIILFAAIGNMVIVGLALIPMTLPHPLKAHWLKNPPPFSVFENGGGQGGGR